VPESRMRWTAGLWPGAAHLWWRGAWSGLVLAVAWTVLLNVVLLATFLWTEWIPGNVLLTGWVALAGIWIFAAGATWRKQGILDETNTSETITIFREAQTEYLRGNWFEAESLLKQLVRNNRRDVEAMLMLATLWIHTERDAEARSELDNLACLADADRWSQEIEDLRRRLPAKTEARQASAA